MFKKTILDKILDQNIMAQQIQEKKHTSTFTTL